MSKEFGKALARHGFKWSGKMLGGSWVRTEKYFLGAITQNTHTGILKLDREDFPGYLAMDPEELRAVLADKLLGATPRHMTDIFVAKAVKPFMQALLEVS